MRIFLNESSFLAMSVSSDLSQYFDIAKFGIISILRVILSCCFRIHMKFGHLLFPVFFFLILILGAVLIMRTVEEQNYAGPNQPVYLDSSQRAVEVTAESVASTREKAHQAFIRFSDSLMEKDALSFEEKENMGQILKLGEAHWSEENWAPAFYAFERVLNDLSPLIDEGLGFEKATEMEARFSDISQNITNEIVLVESTYLEAIKTANLGYNALQERDWITAIQSFAKGIDTLHLVKAQAAEIVNRKLNDAYTALEAGEVQNSTELFNEVLTVYPEMEEAIKGLQLIESDNSRPEIPPALEVEAGEESTQESDELVTNLLVPIETSIELEESSNRDVALGDWHFSRREFKKSLSLYIEVQAKEPGTPELAERILRTRKALQVEETIRLMDKATILTELGQWTGVIKTYRQILNVDPVHKMARRGWEDALVSFVAQKESDQYKELIRHHLNAKQYAHAKELLFEVRNILHDRTNLDELLLPLERELEDQQFPVKIVLESDGETWVTIPGKMAPEQFLEKEITLFPGKLSILGWKRGHKHHAESFAFSTSDAPESIEVICNEKIEVEEYRTLSLVERIPAALDAIDVTDLLTDLSSFSAWVRMGNTNEGPIRNESQYEKWEDSLFSKLYAALSQQADQEFEIVHLEARAHFIQVPDGLTRKETIELGQYLMSRQ
ncbi:MAG: hypothetical protein O7C75_06405 [Verrucomicrobia bacterium]|nr:hypothetical protein [Verrucomicrobiota bacterium]